MAEAGWKPSGRVFANDKGETFKLEILVDDEASCASTRPGSRT